MIHTGITARSGYGKTSMTQKITNILSRMGGYIAVCDEKYVKGSRLKDIWKADFITDNLDEFNEWMWTHTNAICVTEEAETLLDHHERMTGYSRQFGHSMIMSGQVITQFPTKLRTNFDQMIVGKGLKKHGQLIQEILVSENLSDIQTIERYHFNYINPLHNKEIVNFNGYDESVLEQIAQSIMDEWTGADDDIVKRVGIGSARGIDWEYLKAKKLIYTDERFGTENL